MNKRFFLQHSSSNIVVANGGKKDDIDSDLCVDESGDHPDAMASFSDKANRYRKRIVSTVRFIGIVRVSFIFIFSFFYKVDNTCCINASHQIYGCTSGT